MSEPYFQRFHAEHLLEDKTGVLPIKYYSPGVSVAVGTNNVAVAAVTGKKIRVVGIHVASTSAAGTSVSFKSGSGGQFKTAWVNTQAAVLSDRHLPFLPAGYAETDAGVGLYYDVQVGAAALAIQYVEITP